MSIVLLGSTSGSITLQEPAVAGNTVLDLPATSGTLLTSATPFSNGQGPAFSASIATATSMSNNTFTKITYDNEIFDTNNNYTNSTFTPTVAGYYYLTASLSGLSSLGTNSPIAIFKNGGWESSGVNVNGYGTVTAIFYANGSTDYFEVYQYQSTGSPQVTQAPSTPSRFSGCLVRAA